MTHIPDSHRKAFFSSAFPFYASVFVSAFLLFQVQPLIGKYILPWFGGGSSVWTTSILFFELLLLFGYGYAYFVTKLSLKKQVLVHFALLFFISVLLILLFFFWDSPITPPLTLRPPDSFTPVIQVLTVLFLSVGLPYFLLSTTSSLLQKWFSHTATRLSPYPLYSLSNAGSLLGLVTYPFLVEVFLPLHIQGSVWTITFLIFAALLTFSCYITFRSGKKAAVKNNTLPTHSEHAEVKKFHQYLWIIFPMISSMILLSTTSQITQSVAPAPFLWIIPLGLYLLSFILCFSSKKIYYRNIYAYAFLLIAPITLYISLDLQSFLTNLVTYIAFIFVSFMILHGELYNIRPGLKQLNLFYFLEAFGSVLGGIFVAIVAPLIFTDFWEFYVATFLTCYVAILVLFAHKDSLVYTLFSKIPSLKMQKNSLVIGSVIGVAVILYGLSWVSSHQDPMIVKTRNFYGLVSVGREYIGIDEYRTMYNGRINHGGQYLSDELRRQPVSYFGEQSGIAHALTLHPKRISGQEMNIGVTGLGVGTIAAFGRYGDSITFYEINPNATRIAQDYFTYLRDSEAEISIIPGDARISLQNQLKSANRPLYDILVLDAFVDDAIPMHLITKEALEIYLQLLNKNEGILAINISNRYLSLEPVVAKLAENFGMEYVIIYSDDGEYNTASATWALLTYNREFINHPDIVAASTPQTIDLSTTQLWTDDYSNLFQVLYFN